MRHRIALGTVAAALLAFGSLADAPARPRVRSASDAAATLRPASGAGLASLELAETSLRATAVRRQPVTDLVVRLHARPETPLAVALSAPSGERTGRGRALFSAEIIITAGGRILIEERAACGAWNADVSLCRAECDGGTFALVRRRERETAGLSLVVGALPETDGSGFADGLRLEACRDGEPHEASLVPRRGLRQAEIELRAP